MLWRDLTQRAQSHAPEMSHAESAEFAEFLGNAACLFPARAAGSKQRLSAMALRSLRALRDNQPLERMVSANSADSA